jgi:hypothetical protein
MHPKINKMNLSRRVGRKGHKLHKEEMSVYLKTAMYKMYGSDQYYKRAVHTYHGICQMWYEIDSDSYRDLVDAQSSKFRGYSTSFN